MSTERSDVVAEDPHAQLERALIDEYLTSRGHTRSSIDRLPEAQAASLLKQACLYASGRLTEVESRAHYVHDVHDGHQGGPEATGVRPNRSSE